MNNDVMQKPVNIFGRYKMVLILFVLCSSVLMISIGVVSFYKVTSLKNLVDSLYGYQVSPMGSLYAANMALVNIQEDIYRLALFPNEHDELEKNIHTNIAVVNDEMFTYRDLQEYNVPEEESNLQQNSGIESELKKFDETWAHYQQSIVGVLKLNQNENAQVIKQNLENSSKLSQQSKAIQESLNNIEAINLAIAGKLDSQGVETTVTWIEEVIVIFIIGEIVIVFMGIVLAWIVRDHK